MKYIPFLLIIQIVEQSSDFLTVLVVCLLCALLVLFASTYLFNNPFFYQLLGDSLRWEKICRFVYAFTHGFMCRMMSIVCGVMYDLLKKAPLLSVSAMGIGLFQRRGATIVEGALYGALVITIGNRFRALLRVEEEINQEEEEEKETPEEFISFNVSMIVVCVVILVVLFNLKTPWYLRKMSYSLFSSFSYLCLQQTC